MKTFKYLTIAIVAICLASCGGKQNSEETVETEEKVIDEKVLPIPMLGKEIDRIEGETFYYHLILILIKFHY